MKRPTLSVVMPTYNQARFLREALDSVVRQQFEDWEMFVVNDASTDETEEICREYLRDNRIHYVAREVNGKGAGLALNTGFTFCKGKYETWCSSDNVLYSNAWKVMVTFLDAHPDVDYAYSNCELGVMDRTGETEIRRKNIWEEVDQNWDKDKLIRRCGYYGLVLMWRREIRLKVGEFQQWPCEDADFVLRAEEAGCRFAFVPDCLGWYRRHPGNITNTLAGQGACGRRVRERAKTRRRLT